MNRIIYMGTPQFAVEPLRLLLENNYDIAAVITAPDKPSGRGLQLQESDVKKFAKTQNLKILQPVSLKDPLFIEEIGSLDAKLFIVVAFRMLPKEIWELPPLGTFNLHASLLPQYRGAAPINHALINGETETGVTTFFINENIDTGDIIYRQSCIISESDNAGTLHDKLMTLGATLVVKTANTIFSGKEIPKLPQLADNSAIKEAPKLNREFCKINWSNSNTQIHNLIRGLSPTPAAYTNMVYNNKTTNLKILSAETVDIEIQANPGAVIKESKSSFLVQCGKGALRINELQPAGKRRMSASEFIPGITNFDNCQMSNE